MRVLDNDRFAVVADAARRGKSRLCYLMDAGTPEPRVMIGPVQGVQTAALKPPPNSGTFPPIAIGMTPEIGPPLSAEAGV